MTRLPSRLSALLMACLIALTPVLALALDDPAEMLKDPKQEARAEAIGAQLRCLVCQNESIEDSSADLARDLRHVVREHVAKGESDQEVIRWMVARYGNFIRLRPPLTLGTILLWVMPVLAILIGFAAAYLTFRRPRAVPPPLTDAERARLSDLTRQR